MWEGGKMGLLFVGMSSTLAVHAHTVPLLMLICDMHSSGPDAPAPIASMAMDGNAVWVSAGPHLIKYLRGKEV